MSDASEYKFVPYVDYPALSADLRIFRASAQIMSHPAFCLATGLLTLGTITIVEDGHPVTTAATDGVNILFNRKFVMGLNEYEVNFLVLHELGHIMFSHLFVYLWLMKINAKRTNCAMDYVVNGWIVDTDPTGSFARPIKGTLYKPEWSTLSTDAIYRLLADEEDKGDKGDKREDKGDKGEPSTGGTDKGDAGSGEPGTGNGSGDGDGEGDGPLDSHDWESADKLSDEEKQELADNVEQAIREGTILVGKAQGNMSRAIRDILTPKIDWREVFREFINSVKQGKESLTWQTFNRRYLPYDTYLPSAISETVGEIIIAVDTSGSIGDEALAKVVAEMVAMVEQVDPEKIRILWWDTSVAKEQIINRDKSSKLSHIVDAAGGGGTRMGCVSDYINAKNYKPECVVVFTDGYVETKVNWKVSVPTLVVVDGNRNFVPPAGVRVVFK